MIEDKLSKEERIRLEAVSQANQLHGMRNPSVATLIEDATTIETYIILGHTKGKSNEKN